MEWPEADQLVKQLVTGFETLKEEYARLHEQHSGLERKLATAREQYNELAKFHSTCSTATPPLSLFPSLVQEDESPLSRPTVMDVLGKRQDDASMIAASHLRSADRAIRGLRYRRILLPDSENGVKIWTGPSADEPEAAGKAMPSITESPLEQDFTIEGKPSKLGCPFATMASKKLSSHAASVLSRYNQDSSGKAPGTSVSSVSRINGRESFSKRNGHRESFVDPIKAEICGLSDHDEAAPYSERAMREHLEQQENADVGVCPIRFLDQHSPEEVATYFEKHKHELPRSHEVCVKRYQSNEQRIWELDEKYGNLVSMIQGLGAKHKDFLPREPEEEAVVAEDDGKSAEKVRKWANSVSAQDADGMLDNEDDVDREPRFERPLRDIRVGESPSRPWGISVPTKYIEEEVDRINNEHVLVRPSSHAVPDGQPEIGGQETKTAKCPLGFDNTDAFGKVANGPQDESKAMPVFVTGDSNEKQHKGLDSGLHKTQGRMVFSGPVFIGYSAEEAAKILRDSHFSTR